MSSDGAVVAALAKLAAAFQRPLDGDVIAVYTEALGECDPQTLGLAVRRAIVEESRFPVPSVLLGYYGVVRHERNLTAGEIRSLGGETNVSREAQARINRRGRRLMREVGALVHGADIYARLPGDDEPLEESVVEAIKAEARAIVAANARPRARAVPEQELREQAEEIIA